MESWQFGPAVRRWRDRVAPAAVGVPIGGRRRAAGLRREELAGLAGISVDYLTRLEQGRATSPSAQVVEALARALRLGDADRELLFRLAGYAVPGPDMISSRISPGIQRLLDRLSHTPVAVYDATWTLVVANAAYDALMGATTAWRGIERNSVFRHLTGAPNRTVHSERERADLVAGLVADLRATASRYPRDERLRQLIGQLDSRAPGFTELWHGGASAGREELGRHKVVDHPEVGRITLDCDTVIVAADDLRIMIYTAEPGTAYAERLALAIVLGTQSLAGDGQSGPSAIGREGSRIQSLHEPG